MRKWHVPDFENFLVFYLPRRDGISVVRVLYAAQDWWSLLQVQGRAGRPPADVSNHFHLDEKGGCYALACGPVNLMLVIAHSGDSEFAVIEQVFADVDNAKARCFEKTYRGIHLTAIALRPVFPCLP